MGDWDSISILRWLGGDPFAQAGTTVIALSGLLVACSMVGALSVYAMYQANFAARPRRSRAAGAGLVVHAVEPLPLGVALGYITR